eukprot:UN01938
MPNCYPVYEHVDRELYLYYNERRGWIVSDIVQTVPTRWIIKASVRHCRRVKIHPNNKHFQYVHNIFYRSMLGLDVKWRPRDAKDFDVKFSVKTLDVHTPRFDSLSSTEHLSFLDHYSQYIKVSGLNARKRVILPAKVKKLFGVYQIMKNKTLNGRPIYKSVKGLGYLFYCTFYTLNDWRISQTLPQENSNAPARIRAMCEKYTSPCNPELYFETVDEKDQWTSNAFGVSVDWYHQDEEREAVCQKVLCSLGVQSCSASGWLGSNNDHQINRATGIFDEFKKYFSSSSIKTSTCQTLREHQMKVEYPRSLTITESEGCSKLKRSVSNVLGKYTKSEDVLYGAPIYIRTNPKDETEILSYFYYSQPYKNHDWRVSTHLPVEGQSSSASIRAFSKTPCSPCQKGLFWEVLTNCEDGTVRWNTSKELVFIRVDDDPAGDAALTSIGTALGIPLSHAKGWLSTSTVEKRCHEAIDGLSKWSNVIDLLTRKNLGERRSDEGVNSLLDGQTGAPFVLFELSIL